MEEKFTLDPKWIASLYGLSATAVCILVFTYNNTDFASALIKTFLTSVAFYLMGIVVSSVVNFVVSMRISKENAAEEAATEEQVNNEESQTT